MINLTFIDSSAGTLRVSVHSNSSIRDALLEYLKIIGKSSLNLVDIDFIVRGKIINRPKFLNKKVNELMHEGDKIIVMERYVGGGGSFHICPYGCGRNIPDCFKGCTELLEFNPNYIF